MNPWAATNAATPVKLKQHAADLAVEDEAAGQAAEPAINSAAPTRLQQGHIRSASDCQPRGSLSDL